MAKTDTVYSLFGMKTPQEIAQEEFNRRFKYMQGQRSGYQQAGAGIGLFLGGLLGGDSEAMTRAREGEEIIRSTQQEVAQERQQRQQAQQKALDARLGGLEGALATEMGSGMLPEVSAEPSRQQKAIQQYTNQADLYDRMAERLEAGGFIAEADRARTSATEQRVKGFQMQKMIREEQSAIAEERRKQEERINEAQRRQVGADILLRRGKPDMAQAVAEGILPLDTLKDALKEPEAEFKVVGKSLVKIPADGGKPQAVFTPPPEPNTTYTLLTEQEIKANPTLTPGVAYQKNNKTNEITALTGDPKVTQVGDYQVKRSYNDKGELTTSMEIIPGSKTDRELKQRIQATSQGVASKAEKLDLMSEYTDRTIELLEKNPEAAGWQGAAVRDFGKVPFLGALTAGSPTEILDGYLTVIKSNIGFDKLQRMRDESPTGGALGQVAILELIALQNSIAPLEPKVGDKVLIQSLKEIRDTYTKNMEVLANNYTNDVLNQYGMQIAIQYRTVDPVTGKPLQPEGSTADPLGIR